MKKKEYRKLPGKKRHLWGHSTMWVGTDHLLLINSRGYREEYKRFYFHDIQAIITRKIEYFKNVCVGLAIAAVMMGGFMMMAAYSDSLGWSIFCGTFSFVFLLFFLNHLIFGSSCESYIKTAVQIEKIPSFHRLKIVERVVGDLRPAIEREQGIG